VNPVETLAQDTASPRPVVLIVEDEFLLRWPVAEYLRDSGFRVIEAGSVQEAIILLSGDGRIDVVFSDINLPGEQGGLALSRWLDKHRPAIPLLLTSGESVPAELAGIRPFIAKPYSLAEVEERLERMMAQDD
jgi:DNA-binding NtrC family response regulator